MKIYMLVITSVLFFLLTICAQADPAEKTCTCPCTCPETNQDEAVQPPEEYPETIVIKDLLHVYGPVEFGHQDHIDLADSCTTCHHHLKEKGYVPCSRCHLSTIKPFAKRDPSVPALKAAFHRQCMGCHVEWESGPTKCTECHTVRNEKEF